MSDEKPGPVDDLKQGLNLLFRAAKGAVEKLPTDKLEAAVKDGAKEVGKAFEQVGNEIEKVIHRAVSGQPAPSAPEPTTAEGVAQAKDQHDAEEAKKRDGERPVDDTYGPEPSAGSRGPRIG